MRVYQVGGAVRDALLGQPVADRDWVVVGATTAEMTAAGYRPVGRDFPVFLHPTSHEEYALARTERKSGSGYRGFVVHAAPDVSLEDDLARRDLTINAMALAEDGTLVDPHGGRADLAARVLRHVSPAFSEDPVRILRVARFAARFPGFQVAPETMTLMQGMVKAGEVDALVPERVWQEFAKGLMARQPSQMLTVLMGSGALDRLLPEVAALVGVPQRPESHPEGDAWAHTLAAVDAAAARRFSLEVRVAALLHDVGKALTPPIELPRHPGHEARGVPLVEAVCLRWRIPVACQALALLAVRWHGHIHRAAQLTLEERLEVLERVDSFRRPERFNQLLDVAEADFFGRRGTSAVYPTADWWRKQHACAVDIETRQVIGTEKNPEHIARRIREARLAAMHAASPSE